MAATGSANGTSSGPAQLACSYAGDPAIDGAGDAMVLCEGTNVVLTSDDILSSATAADTAGTFVVALQDFTADAATVFGSPPGGSFGMPATSAGYGVADLTIAATGRATLVPGNSSGDFDSTEPVT